MGDTHQIGDIGDMARGRSRLRQTLITQEYSLRPLTPITPPVAAQARICSSVMLRPWSARANAFECEKTTGACERCIASMLVLKLVWVQSTIIPTRFISSMTARPNESQTDILIMTATLRPDCSCCKRRASGAHPIHNRFVPDRSGRLRRSSLQYQRSRPLSPHGSPHQYQLQ